MEGQRISSEDFARFVRQVYRLFKVGTFHLLNNEAVTQTIEQSGEVFRELGEKGFERLSVLFLANTVFVNGTLLKAKRDVYESAQELAALLLRAGYNQFTIDTSTDDDALRDVLAIVASRLQVQDAEHPIEAPDAMPSGARLTLIDPELLDDLVSTELTAQDRTGRTYASAIVLMRYQFDALKSGEYVPPKQLKRLAQQLVLLAEPDNPAFLGVTRMRSVFDDEAGRAVNTAILAVAMARQLTDDIRTLSRVAIAALLHDTGRPRAAGMARGESIPVIPRLTDEQQQRLPASTAVVLTQLGRLHDDALARVVCGFEAQWRACHAEPPPHGHEALRMEALLIFVAQRFNSLLGFDVKAQRRATPDEAVRRLRRGLQTETELRCVQLLLHAIGLVPRGTVVALADGSRGVVVGNHDAPGRYGLPRVLVYQDGDGAAVTPHVVDLARPDAEVVQRGGITRSFENEPIPEALRGHFEDVDAVPEPPPAAPAPAVPPEADPRPTTPSDTDAAEALERILGGYFGDGGARADSAPREAVEHRLGSVPPGWDPAREIGPTGAHSVPPTLESTQDVGEYNARQLLHQYFPEASSPGEAAAPGEPSVRDTLVDGLPSADEMMRAHFGDARTPGPTRTLDPDESSRDALVREYLGGDAGAESEVTREVPAGRSDELLARYRANDSGDRTPVPPGARTHRHPLAPDPLTAPIDSTVEIGSEHAEMLLHDYLDSADDELASPVAETAPAAREAAPEEARPAAAQPEQPRPSAPTRPAGSRVRAAPRRPAESETTRPTPETVADDLLRRYLSDAELPPEPPEPTPRNEAETEALLRKYLSDDV